MTLDRRRAVLLLAGSATTLAGPALATETLTVYAVNAPLAYFARRLAGDAAEVVLPVPADRDPAFWRPSIAEVAEIQAADLILLNGAGYAQWTAKTSLPRSRTADTSRAFADDLIAVEGVVHSHGPEGEHSHAGTASITWLDYAQAADQARAVADALETRLPDRAQAITAALAELERELADLDLAAQRIGAAAAGRRIVASHPRYHYFARAYGLDVVNLDWDAAVAPTPEQWTDFEAARAAEARLVMLWEAEPLPGTRERLEASGVELVPFPTLANTPGDFVELSRENLARLDSALALLN